MTAKEKAFAANASDIIGKEKNCLPVISQRKLRKHMIEVSRIF